MSADRMHPPRDIESAIRSTIERCADIASYYPVFAYDGDTGELLRLRDAISEAIIKSVPRGEMIK